LRNATGQRGHLVRFLSLVSSHGACESIEKDVFTILASTFRNVFVLQRRSKPGKLFSDIYGHDQVRLMD
jgi:hypothetical protein